MFLSLLINLTIFSTITNEIIATIWIAANLFQSLVLLGHMRYKNQRFTYIRTLSVRVMRLKATKKIRKH